MKKPQKTTPTPWLLDEDKQYILADNDFSMMIAQIRGWGWLNKTFGEEQALLIQQANAELIVKAVNNHDKLVEALKKCDKIFDIYQEYMAVEPESQDTRDLIKSILKHLESNPLKN